MLTYQEIVSYCGNSDPDVIYVAIGCSQEIYEPGKESPQEYPPCIAALGGQQICILIDPRLESPLRVLPEATEADILHDGDVSFIPIRNSFYWSKSEDRFFMESLCRLALTRKVRLIVQEYTGTVLSDHYPLATFGPALIPKVLFDFTYNEGGCFIDFSKVHILTHPDGSFIQPLYEPLTSTLDHMSPEQRAFILRQRNNILWCYVKRMHRINAGIEEERDWCTREICHDRALLYHTIYRTPPGTDNSSLENLMLAYLFDLCSCVGDFMSTEDAIAVVRGTGKEYQDAITIMKDILIAQ